jgi:hypothetical protein
MGKLVTGRLIKKNAQATLEITAIQLLARLAWSIELIDNPGE